MSAHKKHYERWGERSQQHRRQGQEIQRKLALAHMGDPAPPPLYGMEVGLLGMVVERLATAVSIIMSPVVVAVSITGSAKKLLSFSIILGTWA